MWKKFMFLGSWTFWSLCLGNINKAVSLCRLCKHACVCQPSSHIAVFLFSMQILFQVKEFSVQPQTLKAANVFWWPNITAYVHRTAFALILFAGFCCLSSLCGSAFVPVCVLCVHALRHVCALAFSGCNVCGRVSISSLWGILPAASSVSINWWDLNPVAQGFSVYS